MSQHSDRNSGGQNRRGGGHNQSGGRNRGPEIPAPREVSYFEEREAEEEGMADLIIKDTLFNEDAQKVAKNMRRVTSTSLRRFFSDVDYIKMQIERQWAIKKSAQEETHNAADSEEKQQSDLELKEALFKQHRAQFKMLKAKAAYVTKKNQDFKPALQFFVDHTHAVDSFIKFEVFHQHFQSVIAFHKFYGKE